MIDEFSSEWQPCCELLSSTHQPQLAIVLGSGLGSIVESIDGPTAVRYQDIPRLPVSKVPGHAGKFVTGLLADVPVVLACGRVHAYEGHPVKALGAHVRFLAQLGVKLIILTNAAGSLNQRFTAGSWMMISDHINLLGHSPLEGSASFVDMTGAYDAGLRESFRDAAREENTELYEGVYAAVRGPQYETPSEVRMLRLLGADAVGMSTVPEVIQARALGLRVAAFSCLTNLAAGISGESLSHAEVVEVGKQAANRFTKLLTRTLAKIKNIAREEYESLE